MSELEKKLQRHEAVGKAQVKVFRIEALVDLLLDYLNNHTTEPSVERLEKVTDVIEVVSEEVKKLEDMLFEL